MRDRDHYWAPRLALVPAVLLALVLPSCTPAQLSHFWRVVHAAVGLGARLAPAACVVAGGQAADCERVRLVATATEEARQAFEAQCKAEGEAPAEGCAAAAVRAAERAEELARELAAVPAPAPTASASSPLPKVKP